MPIYRVLIRKLLLNLMISFEDGGAETRSLEGSYTLLVQQS